MAETVQSEPDLLDRLLAAEPNLELIYGLMGGFTAAMTTEYIRAALVNPESAPFSATPDHPEELPESQKPQPVITEEDVPAFIYEPLQHGGDILEGYIFTATFFTALAAARIKRLSNRVRSVAAATIATSAIAYHELFRQKPDPADIPAGALGAAAAVALIHLFSKDGSGYQKLAEKAS